jgi:anion-transporting  ArsA/GET3 family ATPase
MREVFMGKGGSGKTTLAASFIASLTRYKLTRLIDPRFTYEQVLVNQERSCIV